VDYSAGFRVRYRTVLTMNKVDNGSMLTLRTLEISEGEPYQYEVIGLPNGRGAMLARLFGVWKILKIEPGQNYAWTGSFVSADDALASLEAISGTSS
jgi:hypothetical protein